ncbi:aldehyde dehydrogenase family 2 member C4-like protein [Tanacetum coccineum]
MAKCLYKFMSPCIGRTFETIDPRTEEVTANIAEGDREDVDLAVKAAREAFDHGPWPRMSGSERGRLMMKYANLVEEHIEELAALDAIDAGKVFAYGKARDVPSGARAGIPDGVINVVTEFGPTAGAAISSHMDIDCVEKVQYEKVLSYIEHGKRQGATLLTGGKPCGEKGFYIEPTIFADVTMKSLDAPLLLQTWFADEEDDMLITTDEIFGPVISVFKFKTIEEAITRANATRYGLAAGIATKDLNIANTVSRTIHAGIVWINCYLAFDPGCPYGGYKMSGFGREFGRLIQVSPS